MFEDFENLEQLDDFESERSTNVFEKIVDAFEDFFDLSDENETDVPDDLYEYLESLDAEYAYEKQELPNGIIKESLVWETRSEAVQDAYAFYNIEDATDTWHVQKYSDSCAVACQEFILEEYTGKEYEEDELVKCAVENGWVAEGGTPTEDIGNILEYYGIETSTDYDADFRDLENALNNGDRAIVGVYNIGLDNDYEGFYPAWSANHAIEVIGIDKSNPEDVKVIVNDPGVEDGCGKEIDYDVFMNAWNTSGGFMVVADRP